MTADASQFGISAGARPEESSERARYIAAIKTACGRIAPLWPLKHFVAVNPFLGFAGETFHATCARQKRVARVRMVMPRSFYAQAVADGTILDGDLSAALAGAPSDWRTPDGLAALKEALVTEPPAEASPAAGAAVATLREVLDSLAAGDRLASRTAFMVDEISKWCAAYFDEGQSVWRLPARRLRPYAAWRSSMRHDRNPEVMGIAGFREAIAALPTDPIDAIIRVVERLGLPERAIEEYLSRSLFDIQGWAAYARYLAWNRALYGETDDTLIDLLAIRLSWGFALFLERRDEAFRRAWQAEMEAAAQLPADERLGDDAALAIDLILHEAYEIAYQRRLLGLFAARARHNTDNPLPPRPDLQAAFCIDVRSEIYRRALESVNARIQTIGFAGFFGFPIEYIPIGQTHGGAQCPVLLKPAVVVCEAVSRADPEEEAEILGLRLLRRRAANAWKSFKLSAVSSFIYVESAGFLYASKIFSDSAHLTRTVTDPNTDGLDPDVARRVGPRITAGTLAGRATGFTDYERVSMAEAVLKAMSLTGPFARLVMLTGHGSTTVNNPHASGLDCGACGGHTGEANARVAAAVLNDPHVRVGLTERGITIPGDTWFLGCLHDTTTDEVRIFNEEDVPETHRAELAEAKLWLKEASRRARAERAHALGVDTARDIDQAVLVRSRDWSQVRPEWGLAGNAAFIAAPRHRTRGLDLGGRAFLHEYEWQRDRDFWVLELIMTAPMVVACWINLQYFASTVNNRAFGSGNKVLHNVVGTIGVLEGNAGDLKVGLAWQSVHDGRRFVHEPLRLSVLIEAPVAELNRVIEKHKAVRDLVDHRWLHLFAIDHEGRISHRYQMNLQWEELPSGTRQAAIEPQQDERSTRV